MARVLITTSGVGSRLGELTKYTNKSLVRVGDKPSLSYIIESYPKKTEYVITLGYFGNQVKEFLNLAYPDRKFIFIDVDNYEGEGSSLGYSMLKAKNVLNCPFIFHASDTIVDGYKPSLDCNWTGGYKSDNASSYSSFDVVGNKVSEIKNKGAIDFDYLHIGLVGIKDYKKFWECLERLYRENPNDSTLNDCRAINSMIHDGVTFKVREYKTWLDIGNVDGLNNARNKIESSVVTLDKVDENIFIFKDFVIKFFYNQSVIKSRVKRADLLGNLVPKIESSGKNFYRYKYEIGDLYSRVVSPTDFRLFLNWANKYLWKKSSEVTDKKFHKICKKFYLDKTITRTEKLFEKKNLKDSVNIINGEKVPSIKDILEKIDFNKLSESSQTQFHGDLILDNIIKNSHSGYKLIDWRQDFGGLLESGDLYYDLAKLNHNLTLNHDIINSNQFTINSQNNYINVDIMRKENLVSCQEVLYRFIIDNGYDINKVKLLTAIIWLNMSPLHSHPLDLFLFYFGKLYLWRLVR